MPTLTDPTASAPPTGATVTPDARLRRRGPRRRRRAEDIAAAVARLRGETTQPLADFAGLVMEVGGDRTHPTAKVLLRWGLNGRRGGFLDVTYCHHRLTWVTSREAVARFVDAARAAQTSGGAP